MRTRFPVCLLVLIGAGVLGCRTPAPPTASLDGLPQPRRQGGPAARHDASHHALPRTASATGPLEVAARPGVEEPPTAPAAATREAANSGEPLAPATPAPVVTDPPDSGDRHSGSAVSQPRLQPRTEAAPKPATAHVPVASPATSNHPPRQPPTLLTVAAPQPPTAMAGTPPEPIRLHPATPVTIPSRSTSTAVNFPPGRTLSIDPSPATQPLVVDDWFAPSEQAAAARAARVAEQEAQAEAIRRSQQDLSTAFRRWLGVSEPAAP